MKPTAGPERAGDSVLYAGDVAEKWDLADERTYVFKLRANVKFHNIKPVNGRALTAEDVKYSFERQVALRTTAGFLPAIEKIEVVDSLTLRITLPKPDADFIATLATPQNLVLAREAVESAPSGDLKEGPTIGTSGWNTAWLRPVIWLHARTPSVAWNSAPRT